MPTETPTTLLVAETSPTGAELPDWLQTKDELLNAVMSHPAELIAMALAAMRTTHLPTLLGWLTQKGGRS